MTSSNLSQAVLDAAFDFFNALAAYFFG